MWLERVNSPADLKALGQDDLRQLATEIRDQRRRDQRL